MTPSVGSFCKVPPRGGSTRGFWPATWSNEPWQWVRHACVEAERAGACSRHRTPMTSREYDLIDQLLSARPWSRRCVRAARVLIAVAVAATA